MILSGKIFTFVVQSIQKTQNFAGFNIHRILGTNTFLYKIKVKDCNLCTFCKEEPVTIEHLQWGCHKVS